MRRSTRVAAVCAAGLIVLFAPPVAGAHPIVGGHACLQRSGQVARANGHLTRDVVAPSGPDRLSRWLSRRPSAYRAP